MPGQLRKSKEGGVSLNSKELALKLAEEADKRKAKDIVLIRVKDYLYLTDYFLIASVETSRQARSIVEALQEKARELNAPFMRVEGDEKSGWVLIDVGDVVVHLFQAKLRDYYQLERLWKEAPSVSFKIAGEKSDRKSKEIRDA